MKTRILTITVGAIAAALLAPAALAEPAAGEGKEKGKGPRGERPDRPSREEIMEKFDVNPKDGKLDTAERVTMIKARMKTSERFAEMVNKRCGSDGKEATDEQIAKFAEKMGEGRGRRPGSKRPDGKGPRDGKGPGGKKATE